MSRIARRHSRSLVFVVGVLTLAVAVLFGWIFVHSVLLPVIPGDTTVKSFEVTRGETSAEIAAQLQQEGLVKSSLAFRLYIKLHNLGSRIQSGVYQVSPGQSVAQIAVGLTHGIADTKVTIPEGYRNEQVAEVVSAKLGLSYKELLVAMKGLQGRLFPDTYFVGSTATPADIVAEFTKVYNEKTASLNPTEEDIIIASLVERETRGDAEKGVVAGILRKRLAAGWPLELDATIQYALGRSGNWWPDTTLLDRKSPSPYNTYLHTGLPPAPICNPGLASIEAAVHPVSSPYWFYLHDKSGTIHYAVTNAEQSQNIATYIH